MTPVVAGVILKTIGIIFAVILFIGIMIGLFFGRR